MQYVGASGPSATKQVGLFHQAQGSCVLGFELAVVEQHVALSPDHFALLIEEALDGAAKFAVDDVVHAGRVLRIQTAQLLEAAAGAGFEALLSPCGSNARWPSSSKH